MQIKWRIILTVGIILGLISIIIVPLYYFEIIIPRKKGIYDYMYPNSLWKSSTLSDMVAENDSTVHFCLTNFSQYHNGVDNIIYLKMNFEDEKMFSLPWIEYGLSSIFYQIRLNLDLVGNPFIYLFDYNGYMYYEAPILTIINETWESHPSLYNIPYNCSSTARRSVLNWQFIENGDLMLAFIYGHPFFDDEDTPWIITPVIYNGTTNQGIFMNLIFPEIETYMSAAPGDFKIMDSKIAIVWEGFENSEYVFPYLAINWPKEGWQLYELGDGSPPRYSLAIIPSNGIFNVFSYEIDSLNNIYNLFVTQVINSTYLTTKLIVTMEGSLHFNEDSLCLLDDNTFLFLYTKSQSSVEGNQKDLYLGKYDGEDFIEVRLTKTPDYSESFAHCDLSENFFHYAWSAFNINETNYYTGGPSQIYYNRLPLDEIENIFLEEFLSFSKDSNILFLQKGIYSNIFHPSLIIVLISKKLKISLPLYSS